MNPPAGRRLSVSSWSLHRTLGRPLIYGPGGTPSGPTSDGALPLVELPARLAAFGIQTLELCHFHLPSRDPSYLRRLRGALDDAGVELWSFLIDDGDVTDPVNGTRDHAWIRDWLDVAGALGAVNARVIAGKQPPTPATLESSCTALALLADAAEQRGLRLMTENWLGLMASPDVVLSVLGRLDGRVRFCLDFGNWSGARKYDDLAAIAASADSCHAKCRFDETGAPDRVDYQRCLDLLDSAGFAGPYTLIYDAPDDREWRHLEIERAMVQPYLVEK